MPGSGGKWQKVLEELAAERHPHARKHRNRRPPPETAEEAREAAREHLRASRGAAGRARWRAAVSAHHAEQARGRKWGKSKRTGPGMIRKPPPGAA